MGSGDGNSHQLDSSGVDDPSTVPKLQRGQSQCTGNELRPEELTHVGQSGAGIDPYDSQLLQSIWPSQSTTSWFGVVHGWQRRVS